jgi:probable addiction module antidote protein
MISRAAATGVVRQSINQNNYLQSEIRFRDVAGIARALGDIARAKGMDRVGRAAGLSRESLYKALSEDGNPSLATVLTVAKALGLRLHAEAA